MYEVLRPVMYPDALTTEEAAEFIGANFYTFRASYRRRGVPHTHIGGKPWFFKSDLTEWRRKNPNILNSTEVAKYEAAQ